MAMNVPPPLEHVTAFNSSTITSIQFQGNVMNSVHQDDEYKIKLEPQSPQSTIKQEPYQSHLGGGATRFPCVPCDKWFASNQQLNRHFEAVHKEERRFGCNECGKRFKRKDKLKRHVDAVHRNIRNHECPICLLRFTRRDHLKNHQRVHYGQKQFCCIDCQKRFVSMQGLETHQCPVRGNLNQTQMQQQPLSPPPQLSNGNMVQPASVSASSSPPKIALRTPPKLNTATTSSTTTNTAMHSGGEQKECRHQKEEPNERRNKDANAQTDSRVLQLQREVNLWKHEAEILRNENAFLKQSLRVLEIKQTQRDASSAMPQANLSSETDEQEPEHEHDIPMPYSTDSAVTVQLAAVSQNGCGSWIGRNVAPLPEPPFEDFEADAQKQNFALR